MHFPHELSPLYLVAPEGSKTGDHLPVTIEATTIQGDTTTLLQTRLAISSVWKDGVSLGLCAKVVEVDLLLRRFMQQHDQLAVRVDATIGTEVHALGLVYQYPAAYSDFTAATYLPKQFLHPYTKFYFKTTYPGATEYAAMYWDLGRNSRLSVELHQTDGNVTEIPLPRLSMEADEVRKQNTLASDNPQTGEPTNPTCSHTTLREALCMFPSVEVFDTEGYLSLLDLTPLFRYIDYLNRRARRRTPRPCEDEYPYVSLDDVGIAFGGQYISLAPAYAVTFVVLKLAYVDRVLTTGYLVADKPEGKDLVSIEFQGHHGLPWTLHTLVTPTLTRSAETDSALGVDADGHVRRVAYDVNIENTITFTTEPARRREDNINVGALVGSPNRVHTAIFYRGYEAEPERIELLLKSSQFEYERNNPHRAPSAVLTYEPHDPFQDFDHLFTDAGNRVFTQDFDKTYR